jgi:hypothetical protein
MAGTGRDDSNPVAEGIPFDNDSNGLTADQVQAAIEEVYTLAANASRGATICGFDGSAVTGRWLEFFSNNPSNGNPFIIAEASELVALTISASANSTGTVTVFKNGVALTTISLSNSRKDAISGLELGLASLDELSLQVTSGTITRPTVSLFIRTLP